MLKVELLKHSTKLLLRGGYLFVANACFSAVSSEPLTHFFGLETASNHFIHLDKNGFHFPTIIYCNAGFSFVDFVRYLIL
jgi:hypothetical protein